MQIHQSERRGSFRMCPTKNVNRTKNYSYALDHFQDWFYPKFRVMEVFWKAELNREGRNSKIFLVLIKRFDQASQEVRTTSQPEVRRVRCKVPVVEEEDRRSGNKKFKFVFIF